jgi:hypothetical protein
MTPDHDLESRLRTGLRAAGEALPPAGPDEPAWRADRSGDPSSHRRRRRTWLAGAAAVAVVASAAGVGVVALGGDDGSDEADLEVSQSPTTGPSTSATTTPDAGPGTDPVPGSAVVVGTDLVSLGPDGQPTGTLPLAPLTDVQSVVSDRHGGWIACGTPTPPPDPSPPTAPAAPAPGEPTSTIVPPDVAVASGDPDVFDPEARVEEEQAAADATPPAQDSGATPTSNPNAFRFRPGQAPEPLSVDVMCNADSLGVTEVGGADVLVFLSPAFSLAQLDLATDTVTPLSIPLGSSIGDAAVSGGRLALFDQAGLSVWDLATGEQLAVGPVDLPVRAPDATSGPVTSDVALSPDGTSVAALVGEVAEITSDVVVVDVATGAELFRRSVPVSIEGGQLVYDGTTLAAGNFYDSRGPVHIWDLATGAERTVDTHGLLP